LLVAFSCGGPPSVCPRVGNGVCERTKAKNATARSDGIPGRAIFYSNKGGHPPLAIEGNPLDGIQLFGGGIVFIGSPGVAANTVSEPPATSLSPRGWRCMSKL